MSFIMDEQVGGSSRAALSMRDCYVSIISIYAAFPMSMGSIASA